MKNQHLFVQCFLLLSMLISSLPLFAEDGLTNRVTRLEKQLDGKVLIEIVNEIEAIRRELKELRGELEQQNYSVEQMDKRQQNIFDDLDSRLQVLEGGQPNQDNQDNQDQTNIADDRIENQVDDQEYDSTNDALLANQADEVAETSTNDAIENANAIMPVDSFTGGVAANDNVQTDEQAKKQIVLSSGGDEESSYSEAFNTLKEGDHEGSIEKFETFITQFPDSNYADNAQYWKGEAYYARRKFESAIKEYQKLLKIYPDSGKASHALLKIGYSYDELDEKDLAEGELEDLIARYPGTSAANLAQQRLDHIRTE